MIAFSSSMKDSAFFFMSVVQPSDLFFRSSTTPPILALASLPDTGAYRRASPAPINPPARNATNTPPELQLSSAMTTLLSQHTVYHIGRGGLRARQHPGHGPQNRKDRETQNPRGRIQRPSELPHPFRHMLDVGHPSLATDHDLVEDGVGLADLLRRHLELPKGLIDAPRQFLDGFQEFPNGEQRGGDQDDGGQRKNRQQVGLGNQAGNPLFLLRYRNRVHRSVDPVNKIQERPSSRNRRRSTINRTERGFASGTGTGSSGTEAARRLSEDLRGSRGFSRSSAKQPEGPRERGGNPASRPVGGSLSGGKTRRVRRHRQGPPRPGVCLLRADSFL